MFSKKLIWLSLLAIMPISQNSVADDAMSAILVDRAHYWEKQGRADMAAQAWQELLLAEPANTEALNGLRSASASNAAQPEIRQSVAVVDENAAVVATEPLKEATSGPELQAAAEKVDVPVPVAEVIFAQDAASSPVGVPIAPASTDAMPTGKQVLIERAHYWEKLGRRDMAVPVWQELLLAEPANTEALNGLRSASASNAVQPEIRQSVPVADENAAVVATEPLKEANAGPGLQVKVAAPARIDVPVIMPIKSRQADAPPSDLSDASPAAAPIPGGALSAADKPSRQELMERAQYWESHGRSDLAEKVRSRLPADPPRSGAGREVRTTAFLSPADSVRPGESAVKAALPPPNPAERAVVEQETVPVPVKPEVSAQYWEAHGRSDLAEKARGKSPEPKVVAVRNKITETGTTTAYTETEVQKPSREEMNERAQYWEAHGRADLAAQLRQKLQAAEPRQQPGGAERRETSTQSATRSALEDSLLKNPNSLKARLDLAQIYRSSGEYAKSRVQIESILASNPDLPEALYASAQLYGEQRLWMETMHTLEKINPVSRTPDMARLQKTAWAHLQIDRADALVRQGRNLEAEVLLRQVAAELAVNDNLNAKVEPPPLWKTAAPGVVKSRR